MKTFKLKPEGFEGFIEITLPDYAQRLQYAAEANFKFGKDEQGNNIVEASKDTLLSMVSVLKHVREHIKEVKIKHLESGTEFISIDDVLADSIFDSVMQEIAGILLNGVRLGGK
jgi:hypothetical protein